MVPGLVVRALGVGGLERGQRVDLTVIWQGATHKLSKGRACDHRNIHRIKDLKME